MVKIEETRVALGNAAFNRATLLGNLHGKLVLPRARPSVGCEIFGGGVQRLLVLTQVVIEGSDLVLLSSNRALRDCKT